MIMNVEKASFISKQITHGDYYYLNLSPDPKTKAAIICGGYEECAPSYHLRRNQFKFFCIELVTSGSGELVIEEQHFPLQPGDLFSYGPHTPHEIRSDAQQPLRKYFIDFTGSELIELFQHTAFSHPHPLHISKPFELRHLFETLQQTGNTPSRHQNDLCQLLLRQIILFADDYAIEYNASRSPAWQRYLRCREYIERNFIVIKTMEEVARANHIDKAYLCRLFKRYAGETPLKLLTRLKMNRAAELLTSAYHPLIKQVSEETGYSDPYHFSRVFKRVYGIPPERFLKAARRD